MPRNNGSVHVFAEKGHKVMGKTYLKNSILRFHPPALIIGLVFLTVTSECPSKIIFMLCYVEKVCKKNQKKKEGRQ